MDILITSSPHLGGASVGSGLVGGQVCVEVIVSRMSTRGSPDAIIIMGLPLTPKKMRNVQGSTMFALTPGYRVAVRYDASKGGGMSGGYDDGGE